MPLQFILVDESRPDGRYGVVAILVLDIANGEVQRTTLDGSGILVQADDHLLVACHEGEADVGLCRLCAQSGRIISIVESIGCNKVECEELCLVTSTSEVGSITNSYHLVTLVERLLLEGIVSYKSILFAGQAHLAVAVQQVAVHSGVPHAYLIYLSDEGTVVEVQSRIGNSASTNDEVIGIDTTHVGRVGGKTALSINIDSSSALTQHIQCHMMPGIVGQFLGRSGQCLSCSGIVSILASKQECSICTERESDVTHLQQLGFTRLCAATHPE